MTTTITPNNQLDLIIGSVRWLLDNPDKQAVGRMAFNDAHIPVSPLNPTAECFCLVGRIVHDADKAGMLPEVPVTFRATADVSNLAYAFLEPIGISTHQLITANDREDFDTRQIYLRRVRDELIKRREDASV